MTDEVAAHYDEAGSVVGAVTRRRLRHENLWHAASSVVVRDSLGRIYLHRRTTTKDVYPGLLDFAAGGVVLAGEDPAAGAVREVEEELGVVGVPLTPHGVVAYGDAHTRYHAHRFVVVWDGPIRWQPEEVSGGEWVTLGQLVDLIEDAPHTVVPDSAAVWSELLLSWGASETDHRAWAGPGQEASGRVPRAGPGESLTPSLLLRCEDGSHRRRVRPPRRRPPP